MTPTFKVKKVRLAQGIWCDGHKGVLTKGTRYIIAQGGQAFCLACADKHGITYDQDTGLAGALA